MCTAVTYKTRDFYFGRTLDNELSYNEQITITPRAFPFSFRNGRALKTHYAIIGMAYICNNYPLYFDAMNEKGLCMAGLNFVGNAHFFPKKENADNVAVYEFIPWLLSQCESVREAKRMLEKINLTDTPFNNDLPTAQLHWLIADRNEAITAECMRDGLHIHNNDIGVLTNNPPFEIQLHNLTNFINLTADMPENRFSDKISLTPYSKGMGALGLPGDLSSQSRFVRAAFVKMNSVAEDNENDSISQFFHILSAVNQQRGCCRTAEGFEITRYTSCMNADKGIYYYTTYNNHQISAVDMHREELDCNALIKFSLINDEQINFQN